MKPVIIIAIAFVLLISLGSSNTSYADLDVETIDLELLGWKKIESDKSDVLILTMSFINNGKYEARITADYVYFVDSQERLFESAYLRDLQDNGFSITAEDCPINSGSAINPGLSTEMINCYEVPKGIGDSFSLVQYSTLRGLCEYYECTFKSYPFTLAQQTEPQTQIDPPSLQLDAGPSDTSIQKIPDWVKNIYLWYGQDKVSENEVLNAIQYLITEGILIIPPEQQTQIDPPSLQLDAGPSDDTIETTQSSALCSGNARCITGTVTQVTDGDTINVGNQAIRFALAFAPELYENGGNAARKFIEEICPVGSTATVDEDDSQTRGSYGRIVGVIYCNGVNLNEELVDSGLGYLSTGFCDKSEFANDSWAVKHGCVQATTNDCDPSYPDFCIPSSPPDLDCGDIPQKRFTVLQPDPHRFDGDKDGIGCES